MRSDERAMTGRALLHLLEEATILFQRCIAPPTALAIARLVREDAAEADLVERRFDPIERAIDRAGRRVQVDDTGRTGPRRPHRADERRRVDEIVIERLVERPPHPLQMVGEGLRLRWWR